MKKIIFTSLSFASIFFLLNDPTLSGIACNYSSPLTEAKAKACIDDAIKNNLVGLYSMANRKNHLGNLADCTKKKGLNTKSYFPTGKNNFNLVLKGTTVSGNCIYNTSTSTYNCWVTPEADVCYIPRNGSGKRGITDIVFGVGGGEITTFHPSPRRS